MILTKCFTHTHNRVLAAIREKPGMKRTEIHQALGRNSKYVNVCILDLVDAGMVERHYVPGLCFERYFIRVASS